MERKDVLKIAIYDLTIGLLLSFAPSRTVPLTLLFLRYVTFCIDNR